MLLSHLYNDLQDRKTFKLSGNAKDLTFLSAGFSNWKDATVGFTNHEKSTTYRLAVEVVVKCTKILEKC